MRLDLSIFLLCSLNFIWTEAASNEDVKGCTPRAFQFQNQPSANMDTRFYYNFQTSKPNFNTTLQELGILTWVNSTHQDEGGAQLSSINGHTSPNGVGEIPFFGSFNGSQFYGYNGVPVGILSNFTVPLPMPKTECVLYMEATASFRSLWPYQITSCAGRANDPFYGAGYVTAVDTDNWLEFGFYWTNHKIYALYARWPNGWSILTPTTNYAAFVYLVPLADRTLESFNHVALAFDRKTRTVKYILDGRKPMVIRRVGLPIDKKFLTNDFGGLQPVNPIFPTRLAFEMGVMTPTRGNLVKGACQGLYDPCAGGWRSDQPVEDAWATICKYVDPQSQSTYNVTLIMDVQHFSVGTACSMPEACPCSRPL